MIRFKNNVLPVWIQWDGDEEYFERAKQSIIDDIRLNGLDHYTGYADLHDEASDEEKQWDGAPAQAEIPVKETTKSTTKKAAKVGKKSTKGSLPKGDIDKFADSSDEVSTDNETAS